MKKVLVKGYKRKSPREMRCPRGKGEKRKRGGVRESERDDYAKGVRRSVAESGRHKETRDTDRVLTIEK